MSEYLSASFLANKPYDAMVRELVTATGDAQPGSRGVQRGGQLS